MIEIYTGNEALSRPEPVLEMFRLRHRVFKERLGWEVKSRNGLEIDDYDTAEALYLLAYDDSEQVAGTWRLLPTTGPYMLKDTFPQLLNGRSAPEAGLIWETSRFAVDKPIERTEGPNAAICQPSHVTQELFLGLVEYCIRAGISQVYTVYDIRIARILPKLGCKPFWQSAPQRIGVTVALAGAFETTPQVLASIRRACGISQSVLRERAPSVMLKAA